MTLVRVRRKPTKRQRKIRASWAEQRRKDQAEIAAVKARNEALRAPSDVRIWTEADL
jgi:hypothetical protein